MDWTAAAFITAGGSDAMECSVAVRETYLGFELAWLRPSR